ncbi:two component system response regulator [Streptomyces lincolnensis]|uniref:Two component system response regulator n=1 Tax=Streptomyces lincolnensis TaxID=1915 RepID=A0A1B1MMC7_STRLN|nr:response regulator transcription factor [Streptomyces lincolnensis]ANS69770.1 two component system response regulator [Streptomyces lincolnensis]AXG58689.1 two component system response regulator [Streptomyces lincolnensis]QMV11313.1 response regulator [Streptomyces lincolnensis]
MTVRIVLADDQTVVRAGFRALLDLTDDLVVVAEAADGKQAVEAVRLTRPDVVLMDIRMPGVDGIEATRRIAADPDLDAVRVLVLTTYQVDAYVFEALRHGAAGFLLKDVEPDELRAAIRAVADGGSLLAPAVTRAVVEEFARLKAPEAAGRERLAVLTAREREVMALVAGGLGNEEIGAALLMSPLTAKTHVSRAMTKLGARDRAQLVVLAYETGLVRPGER